MNIYDIAQKSGVSIATVSRVINDNKNVSLKTRETVLRVIHESGYTPNAFARGLGLNTMKQVGILVSDISDTYYANEVAMLEKILCKSGFDVLLKCTGTDTETKKSMLVQMLKRHVDAVILVGSIMQEKKDNSHIRAAAEKIPVVMVNGYVKGKNIVSVHSNEKEGVCSCVHDMARARCRNLLFVFHDSTCSCEQKTAGFQRGLAECTGSGTPLIGKTVCIPGNFDAVVQGTVEYLHENPTDGIIGADDMVAVAVQKALLRLGKSVPLVGINNSVLAKAATPAISSIDNMAETVCCMAVQNLLDIFQGKRVPEETVVSTEFIERESFIRKNRQENLQ